MLLPATIDTRGVTAPDLRASPVRDTSQRAPAGTHSPGRGRELRALNVQQPWASLIASGAKTLEVRSWTTRYRGPVVIVASRAVSRHPAAKNHRTVDAPRGVTVCVVDLVAVIEGLPRHADRTGGVDPSGHYCWVLERPRVCAHVEVRGKLGLWRYRQAIRLRA